MRTISPAVLLGVLGTIARLSLAQCQPGEEVTPDGGCCPVNTKYFQSDSGKEYACCRPGETFHVNHDEGASTCCGPNTEYDGVSNHCVKKEVSGGSQKPMRPKKPEPSTPAKDPCEGCDKCCENCCKPKDTAPPASPSTPGEPAVPEDPATPKDPVTPGNPIKPVADPPGLVTPPRGSPPIPISRCRCSAGIPCATKESLGIQYGKCYNLIDTNGLPLNRKVDGVYQSGGDVGNLMFRVCKTTDDCSTDAGTFVPAMNGKFFLQDQQGWTGWQGPGWFAKIRPHFKIDFRSSLAAQFKGEDLCVYGSPAICLRDAEKNLGMTAPCPLYPYSHMSHIGFADNPNSCKAYRFIEASCLTEMGAQNPKG